MKLSLIVPCYNEEKNVSLLQEAIINTFKNCHYDYEIIFVDDGSSDSTWPELRKIHKEQWCSVKAIRFSRNFGKEAAIFAGLQQADGDYVSLIDADLQQPPEIVRSMVSILEENPQYDVVAAYQEQRNEPALLSFFKKSFYKIINTLTNINLRSDASDFRTFRKCVAESIISLGEYHRFSKGLFAWVGFNTCYIPYTANPRTHGKSKWGFFQLLNYATEGIIGYSIKPLRIATFLGGLTSFASMLYLIIVVLQKLIQGIDIPGYATIIVLILLLGGMQLFCIGIIGEYVGKAFEQSKYRPIYIAKEILD